MKIVVFGAGVIGCWLGARLAAGNAAVTLIGRARVMAEVSHGLTATDLDGGARIAAVVGTTDPEAAREAALVLVTVKSGATAEAGRVLAAIGGTATVVSLQNGVRNAATLRDAMPGRHVVAGMVPFNVVRRGPGHYHRASQGTLAVAHGAPALIAACGVAGVPIVEHADLDAVQWAKLVMNLNNAINALSGRPLADELARRAYRRCLAAAQREALGLIARAGQPLARLTAIPARWMPRLLELPDAIFTRAARRVLAIDPTARSSMWDDLEAGRPTEIDYLQGEIVALAARLGRPAPINARLVALVRAAEAGGQRDWDGDALYAALTTPTP